MAEDTSKKVHQVLLKYGEISGSLSIKESDPLKIKKLPDGREIGDVRTRLAYDRGERETFVTIDTWSDEENSSAARDHLIEALREYLLRKQAQIETVLESLTVAVG